MGALNLISGQTNGTSATLNGTGDETDGGDGSLTVIGDPNPHWRRLYQFHQRSGYDGRHQYRHSPDQRRHHLGLFFAGGL